MDTARLGLGLTPHGRLQLTVGEDAAALSIDLVRHLQASFVLGPGHGLLYLGANEVGTALPPVFAFWRDFAARYVAGVCTQAPVRDLPADQAEPLASSAPPMRGAEYLTADVLSSLWRELDGAFGVELADSGLEVQAFLQRRHSAWNLVGRVHFNLAENRQDLEAPFAFLATYTTRLSAQAKAQHLPLGRALTEYAGSAKRDQLLSLLLPVQRAAESCPWLRELVNEGDIYHPLRWSPQEAMRLLKDAAQLEKAGVVVRMPAQWSGNRPARPRVSGTVGAAAPSSLGMDALLDFEMAVTLDGEQLTAAEIRGLLEQTNGLALVRGRWVELDRERLEAAMAQFREAERTAKTTGLPFAEAMRLLAGVSGRSAAEDDVEPAEWAEVSAGPWMAQTLQALRSPEAATQSDPGDALRGTLRPYQRTGVRWLHMLSKLGLGACLADDMGLGKTIQVLSLLLVLQREQRESQPSLLIAPASLLANWAAEIERFAPGLKAMIAHPSAMPAPELKTLDAARLSSVDLVITSYGSVLRMPWIEATPWRMAVLDEAQAIKNPQSKQTRAVKKLKAKARLAMTGTPVENRLGDLWSIFDFINPGLLGSAKDFTRLTKKMGEQPLGFAPLRELVRPYILRRLKTDKRVIADLPDKTELKAFCMLSRKQAALYQQAVKELTGRLESAEGIQRKGLVLSFLMRFKQICNHPSQWLGDQVWDEAGSGKWARLREIAEVVASKQEKMLVFTQFREVTAPLAAFLGSVFGSPGLVLHGDTDVKKRKDLVKQFQEDEASKFFVLSLKAGGVGLNLTAASHVVHFDRWWNPAVENQATDRAFRIGQTKNVLVHKFVCRGTLEEKIDTLIESKRQLSSNVLGEEAGVLLTEMQDDELLKMVALDIHKALGEEHPHGL